MIQESIEDFRKRYKGTYLFLTVRGKEHLVRYESDNEEDFCFFSAEFGDILVDEETARENISFYFPTSGLYNFDNGVHHFARKPIRQWKRALCEDNGILIPLITELKLNTENLSISMPQVKKLFKPHYAGSIANALLDKRESVAINRNFAISASHQEDQTKKILWYLTSPVGIIDPNMMEITVKYQPFYQEVIDFIRKKEYMWTVKRS